MNRGPVELNAQQVGLLIDVANLKEGVPLHNKLIAALEGGKGPVRILLSAEELELILDSLPAPEAEESKDLTLVRKVLQESKLKLVG